MFWTVFFAVLVALTVYEISGALVEFIWPDQEVISARRRLRHRQQQQRQSQ